MPAMRTLLLVLSFAAVAWAQSARSVIVGRVTDPSGAAISGAKVTVDTESGFSVTAATADSGAYSHPNLSPGRYRVTVATQGFRTEVVNDVVVNLDQTVRIDVKLAVGDVATSWK